MESDAGGQLLEASCRMPEASCRRAGASMLVAGLLVTVLLSTIHSRLVTLPRFFVSYRCGVL